MTTYNIIAKVDALNAFGLRGSNLNIPLNEAIRISDSDYEKFKKHLSKEDFDENIKSIERYNKIIEKEKEENFQKVFKELWPNTYNRINEPITKETPARDIKNCNLCLLDHIKCSNICNSCSCTPNTKCLSHSVSYSKCNSICLCEKKANTNADSVHLDIYLKSSQTNNLPTTNYNSNWSQKPKTNESLSYYPNIGSSYDFPIVARTYSSDLVKSPYNNDKLSSELSVLQSIKETNDKLRLQNKIEKTNYLVDEIIDKVSILQNDLKKKATEIKIKENINKLKENSIKSCLHRPRSVSRHRIDDHMCSSSRRSKTPPAHNNHHHHFYYDKPHSHSSKRPLSTMEAYLNEKKKFDKAFNVQSRVNSWNYNY